jgi:hypothetical protein
MKVHLTMCHVEGAILWCIIGKNYELRFPVEGDFISPAPLLYNLLFLLGNVRPK